MKRAWLGLGVLCLVGGAVAWSGQALPVAGLAFKLEERNPVTHLRLNNDPAEFQFAIISDRTGGHRAQVFARAVDQINLLQPEFVVSVGDLIEGYTTNQKTLATEWREFQGYVSRLHMPFFYVPGNHDISNLFQEQVWKERFGRRYYHFVYKNVLFLLLNSEDPPNTKIGSFSKEQHDYIRKTLAANRDVLWTLVFFHQPIWHTASVAKTGWLEIEETLKGRPYTVFAGHLHQYRKFVRNGQNYYQLATTGGSSKMRGVPYREFDHIVWVTMKKTGPVLANVLLDGVLPEDLRAIETGEAAAPEYHRKPTHPVRGTVTLHGQPVPQAYVVFQSTSKETGAPRGDAFTEADGSFTLSAYEANDGAPAGDYVVTVTQRKPLFDEAGLPGPNALPERFARPETSGLKFTVKSGANEFDVRLVP